MWVAPMAMMRAGGTSACTNTGPSAVSSSWLLPVRKRRATSSGRPASPRSNTLRRPSARLVRTTRPLRPSRAFTARSISAAPPPSWSSRSTNTLTWPPQGRPTFHAVSSATPNARVPGRPCASVSSAWVITSPSMQPPETEPSKRPSLAITICPPMGTGAEPQVSTTVAMATLPCSASQSRALVSTSWATAGLVGEHVSFITVLDAIVAGLTRLD